MEDGVECLKHLNLNYLNLKCIYIKKVLKVIEYDYFLQFLFI